MTEKKPRRIHPEIQARMAKAWTEFCATHGIQGWAVIHSGEVSKEDVDRYTKHFAGEIQKYVERHGITLADFARRINHPLESLEEIVQQKRSFYMSELYDIAQGLGRPAWELMKEADERPES